MKRSFRIIAVALLSLAAQLRATSADLKVSGNKIVTVSGSCPIFFKGVNIPSMEWMNAPDGPTGSANGVLTSTQYMVANWGANIVRVPLNQDRWLGTACGITAATYQGYVDQIVNWCNTNNVYVLLDLHWSDTGTAGGGSVCSSGQHDMPDDNSSTFWTSVATRYANNPAVLFDLYNEPKGISSWSEWRNGGNAQTDGGYHSPGMQGLLTTIRATGANNIVVAGGLNWAFDLTQIGTYALTDTASGHGVVYATHIYPWKASPCDQAGGCFDGAVPASIHNTYAVMVTEFGQNNGANGVPNNSWAQSVMTWAKANANGYIAWCLHTSASPCLISDWSYTPTSWFGTTVKADMLATSAGGCVGTATFTPTNTATKTNTPTNTATNTATKTNTPVPPTSTPTPTATATGTNTSTNTATKTNTPIPPSSTPTSTATATGTHTATRTNTSTSTNTGTPTITNTPLPGTSTFTSTATSTGTPTSTGTYTSTSTSTRTYTLTATNTPTSTSTPTGTHTSTATVTHTPLPGTSTFTSTATSTGTPTNTATPTSTSTLTGTPTNTKTPVPGTPTPTPSLTRTPTLTDTPVVALPTSTSTSVPSGNGGPLEILHVVAVPNPNPTSIQLELSGPADEVELFLYSRAETKVRAWTVGGVAGGWVTVPLGAHWSDGLASDTYYLVAEAKQGGRVAKRKIAKLLLLR